MVPRSDKETYRRRVQGIVLRLAFRNGEASPDDVHAVLPCPPGIDPKNFGLAFRRHCEQKDLVIIDPMAAIEFDDL